MRGLGAADRPEFDELAGGWRLKTTLMAVLSCSSARFTWRGGVAIDGEHEGQGGEPCGVRSPWWTQRRGRGSAR